MLFLGSPASLVEFLNDEKSSLLKFLDQLWKKTKTLEHANFI